MIIYAQQNGTGPIVSLPMGANSAPAALADAPVLGSLVSSDLFLIDRGGTLSAYPFGEFSSISGSAAASAAVAAVGTSLTAFSAGLTAETARAEGAEAAISGSLTTLADSVATISSSASSATALAVAAGGSISTLSAGLAAETARAEAVEASQNGTLSAHAGSLSTLSALATATAGSVTALSTGLSAETARAEAAESANASGLSMLSGSFTTIAALAEAALPSSGGTLTGPLAFTGSGTLSTGNELYLSPTNQLWLGAPGGAGAVYSATIGGVTSNPGTLATNKLWNNGGVVSVSTGTIQLPSPAFAPAFMPSQVWADIAGSAAVFSHNGGIVPAPLTPSSILAGMLFGDRWKLSGVYNFGEIFATQTTYDAWPALQNFLLYVQLMKLAQMGTAYDNVAERTSLTVYLPAGDYMVSQPLIVPDGVRLHMDGRIVRVPYTGNQSNDGTHSVPGIFDSNQFLPTLVVVPRAHLGDANIYVNGGGTFATRGSGVCIGKNWQAFVGGSVTVGNPGSGYSVGDIVVLANPSPSPYSGWTASVTSVNGAGGITGAVVGLGGAYALPPATYNGGPSLQQQQWTPANGFSVFDPANPGYFLQNRAFRSDFSTPSPGTGATLLPQWQQDFQTGGGQYMCGAALTNGTQVRRLQITGGVPDVYDFTGVSGGTFNLMLSGLECEIDSVQGIGGHEGVWASYAQDCRIGRMNFVETNIPFWARGAGSIECVHCVFDTCGSVLVIDQSHGIVLHGRAFYEEGNIGSPSANPIGINAQSYPPSGGTNFAMLIGSASTSEYPCSCLDIKFTVINMGGLPASTIAEYGLTGVSASQQAATCFLSYLFSSTIDLTVSNTSQYGGNPSPLPTSGIYQFGYGVDRGNDLRGSIDTVPTIDGVPPPAKVVTTYGSYAFPACAIRVWDGLHECWVGPYNTIEMFGAYAPSNGGTGTAAGLAAPGSTFVDTTPGSGRRYVNTNTQASPTWS